MKAGSQGPAFTISAIEVAGIPGRGRPFAPSGIKQGAGGPASHLVPGISPMFFKLVSLAMAGIAALFAFSIDSEHVFAAVMIPSAAAAGIFLLAST